MSPDIAASIKARLLNKAKQREEEFEFFLVRFACERFLFRLGVSEMRDRCTLKGAGLLTLWFEEPYRGTRDVDLLASGESDEAAVRAIMERICRVPCPEDALVFDLATLTISPIRDEQEFAGQRAILHAHLGKARIRLQVDFGFGDAVTIEPEDAELPTLIDRLPAPVVRTYPKVATVAEKFEAMVQLGRRNSRMKDFHDLWALSQAFAFDGAELRAAIAGCFERRGTGWTSEVPDALTPAFYSDADVQSRWRSYRRSSRFVTPPPERLEQVGERLRAFLGPVRESIMASAPFETHWPAGGSWQHGTYTGRGQEADV
ncbi:MAG: nucleotidyl transferase AbiEii/AbiGii toxin family protein [Vicinamibacteria bacterium]